MISVIGGGIHTPQSGQFLNLVVELVNCTTLDGEDEAAVAAVYRLISGYGYDGAAVNLLDLATLRFMRTELHRLLDEPDFEHGARLISLFLERSDARPVLVTSRDGSAELSMTSGNTSISDAVMADVAVALAELASRGGLCRLGLCAAQGCGKAYYDRSQAGNRRYCDPQTCGNRANVAAYRNRRRSVVGP